MKVRKVFDELRGTTKSDLTPSDMETMGLIKKKLDKIRISKSELNMRSVTYKGESLMPKTAGNDVVSDPVAGKVEKVNEGQTPKKSKSGTFWKKKMVKEVYDPMTSKASKPISDGNDDMYHNVNTNVDPRYVPEKKEVKMAGNVKVTDVNNDKKLKTVGDAADEKVVPKELKKSKSDSFLRKTVKDRTFEGRKVEKKKKKLLELFREKTFESRFQEKQYGSKPTTFRVTRPKKK